MATARKGPDVVIPETLKDQIPSIQADLKRRIEAIPSPVPAPLYPIAMHFAELVGLSVLNEAVMAAAGIENPARGLAEATERTLSALVYMVATGLQLQPEDLAKLICDIVDVRNAMRAEMEPGQHPIH